jgi:hypothetical protein
VGAAQIALQRLELLAQRMPFARNADELLLQDLLAQ